MRLATIRHDGREIAAVVNPDGAHVPVSAIASDLPDTVSGLLQAGLTAEITDRLVTAAASSSTTIAADDVVPAPLLRRVRKAIGIGLNYRDHAADLSAPFPDSPASFPKWDHTIIGPGDEIVVPPQSERTTAEAELGLVFGRDCKDVAEADALDVIAGFVPILDQTAEDILQVNPRFLTRSKNFPTFLSLGSTMVTTDEMLEHCSGDLSTVKVGTFINGELHRENVVAAMAFPPAYLVSFHTHVMPFFAGDILSPGTPGAVPVGDGDIATCKIDDGWLELSNPVRMPHG